MADLLETIEQALEDYWYDPTGGGAQKSAPAHLSDMAERIAVAVIPIIEEREAAVDCQHEDREKRPARLGDMRHNPETDRVEAPVLEFAWVCTACGKELE